MGPVLEYDDDDDNDDETHGVFRRCLDVPIDGLAVVGKPVYTLGLR